MKFRKHLIRLLKPKLIRNYEYVRKIEFLPRDAIENLKQDNLRKLLIHAYLHVPYYRALLDKEKEVFAKDLGLEEFLRLPFLTKEILRKEFDKLRSNDLDRRRWEYNTSGGSTGMPVRLIQDSEFIDWRANKFYFNYLAGKDIGEKEIKLWGSERDILKGSIGLRAKLENYVLNRKLLNAFRITEPQMKQYVKEFNEFRPKSVWAYVDSVYELARYVDKNKLKIHSPDSIIVTAGTLTDEVRKYIEDVFQTKVFNQYGSREVGDIAAECDKHEGLHIFEHTHYVEVLDADARPVKEGEQGEVVITLLNNYAMPLIRYKIGDTAILGGACSCGRGFRLLKKVTGRVTDHFRKKDGTIIHGEYFTHLFYFRDWIKKFKVVQEDYNLIKVKIVLSGDKNQKDIADIKEKIEHVMGRCKIEFEFVDEIAAANSGKYLYTESKVN